MQGDDGVKEWTKDAVGGEGGFGLETAIPIEWKGHCLAEYVSEGLDYGVVPRLRGWAILGIS